MMLCQTFDKQRRHSTRGDGGKPQNSQVYPNSQPRYEVDTFRTEVTATPNWSVDKMGWSFRQHWTNARCIQGFDRNIWGKEKYRPDIKIYLEVPGWEWVVWAIWFMVEYRDGSPLNILTLGFQSREGGGGVVMSSLVLLIASHQLCGISVRWSANKQTQLARVQSCLLCPPYPYNTRLPPPPSTVVTNGEWKDG